MPGAKLREFLDSHRIQYISITHSPAYTAQGIAAMVHIPGRELAKTVIVKIDDRLAMAVIPASRQVSLVKLRAAVDALDVAVAQEHEFMDRFPDCELGAMPPFGILYDLPLYVDESLSRDHEIAFNAGSHRELIRMSYKDYAAVAKPVVLDFATTAIAHAA